MIIPLEKWGDYKIVVSCPGSNDPVGEALENSEERVALDIHVGDAYERNTKKFQVVNDIVLRPGECVRIGVREGLQTPMNVLGMVTSRASLSSDGLFVANLKIDPNFSGHLSLAVANASRHPIHIGPNAAFASIIFVQLSDELSNAPPRFPTPSRGIVKQSWRVRARVAWPYAATGAVTLMVQAMIKVAFG